jgi:hypothetical protein
MHDEDDFFTLVLQGHWVSSTVFLSCSRARSKKTIRAASMNIQFGIFSNVHDIEQEGVTCQLLLL